MIRYNVRLEGQTPSKPLRLWEMKRLMAAKLRRHGTGRIFRLRQTHGPWGRKVGRHRAVARLVIRAARVGVGERVFVRDITKDRIYVVRKIEVVPPISEGVRAGLSWAEARRGTPYILGGETDAGFDCSWTTREIARVGTKGRVILPHYTVSQMNDPNVKRITWAEAREGDFLFLHGPDHVATLHHFDDEGRPWVIDQEPSSCIGPDGRVIPGGLQIRPAFGNYYCAPQYLTAVGRVEM